VHWNEDLYGSYEEAARSDDGIVILAVFVQVGTAVVTFLASLAAYIAQSPAVHGARPSLSLDISHCVSCSGSPVKA